MVATRLSAAVNEDGSRRLIRHVLSHVVLLVYIQSEIDSLPSSGSTPCPDIEEIHRGVQILCDPGLTYEVRTLYGHARPYNARRFRAHAMAWYMAPKQAGRLTVTAAALMSVRRPADCGGAEKCPAPSEQKSQRAPAEPLEPGTQFARCGDVEGKV